MEAIFKYLLGALGGSTVGLTIAALLGKKWLSHQLDKNLIQYQKKLETKTEILKNSLSIFAHEQNVGISRIDAQRAEAIKNIYSAIVQWRAAVSSINFPKFEYPTAEYQLKFYKESEKAMSEAVHNLSQEITKNAIFFSPQTYDNLMSVFNGFTIYSSKIVDAINTPKGHFLKERVELIQLELEKAKAKYDQDIDPIRASLIGEFRLILKAQ